jgi:hypothetical protein
MSRVKLSETARTEIAALYASEQDKPRYGRRWTEVALAEHYGVARITIRRIIETVPTGDRPFSEGCCVLGCDDTGRLTRGMCRMHYTRWRRHGNPLFVMGEGVPRTDSPTYFTKHGRVKKARGSASQFLCRCGRQAEDWATVHGTEGLDVWRDYQPMCTRCHMHYDGIAGHPKLTEADAMEIRL